MHGRVPLEPVQSFSICASRGDTCSFPQQPETPDPMIIFIRTHPPTGSEALCGATFRDALAATTQAGTAVALSSYVDDTAIANITTRESDLEPISVLLIKLDFGE